MLLKGSVSSDTCMAALLACMSNCYACFAQASSSSACRAPTTKQGMQAGHLPLNSLQHAEGVAPDVPGTGPPVSVPARRTACPAPRAATPPAAPSCARRGRFHRHPAVAAAAAAAHPPLAAAAKENAHENQDAAIFAGKEPRFYEAIECRLQQSSELQPGTQPGSGLRLQLAE